MKMQNVVPEPAQGKCSRVQSVRLVGREDVFNMEVDDYHNYAIQGGLIVHNCEALRYGLMSRPSSVKELAKPKAKILKLVDPFEETKETKGGFLAI